MLEVGPRSVAMQGCESEGWECNCELKHQRAALEVEGGRKGTDLTDQDCMSLQGAGLCTKPG